MLHNSHSLKLNNPLHQSNFGFGCAFHQKPTLEARVCGWFQQQFLQLLKVGVSCVRSQSENNAFSCYHIGTHFLHCFQCILSGFI